MIGLTISSRLFCLSANSSFSASWFASSHAMVSSTAFSSVALSSSETLPASFSSRIELRTWYE